VPHSGPPAARGHLRLAEAPDDRRQTANNRALLLLGAIGAALALVLLTIVATITSAVALLPVAWRRAPEGVRLRPLRPREARIIPFQRPRRKALPR
jgi:hypothetical protein